MINRSAKEYYHREWGLEFQPTTDGETPVGYRSVQIEADESSWGSMTTAQRLAVTRKMVRREVLKQKLGVSE